MFTVALAGYETTNKFGGPTEPHFHIYIETEVTRDTIINYAYKLLGIKKGQKGTANKYFACKNWNDDIGYFVKSGTITYTHNITVLPEKIEEGYNMYIKPYLNDMITVIKQEASEPGSPASGASPTAARKPPKDEWSLLFMAQPQMETTANWEPIDWRKWICKYYLARTRPVPRTGDLFRYAISLHILRKSKGAKLENILDTEVNNYVESLEKI